MITVSSRFTMVTLSGDGKSTSLSGKSSTQPTGGASHPSLIFITSTLIRHLQPFSKLLHIRQLLHFLNLSRYDLQNFLKQSLDLSQLVRHAPHISLEGLQITLHILQLRD
jgi:hypothetical protein